MPTGEHETSITFYQRFSMGVEVAEHGVTTPAADDSNFIRIDAGEEEGHGSTSAKGASSYLVGMNTSVPGDCEGY